MNIIINFLSQPIGLLKGISNVNSYFYNRLNIKTFRDCLFFLPKKYITFSKKIVEYEFIVIQVQIIKKRQISNKIFEICAVFEGVKINFYVYNIRFYKLFFINKIYNIGGVFEKTNNVYKIKNLKIFNYKQNYFTMYSNNVSSYSFQKYIREILSLFPFDELIVEGLYIKSIFYNLHHGVDYEKSLFALKYLEAMFFFNLFSKKEKYESINIDSDKIKVPFNLSEKQKLISENISNYLSSNQQMHYLVYGEVGSGKTIIAITAILMIMQLGFTAILLAPTVALSVQHYDEIIKIINPLDCLLYTGNIKNKAQIKNDIYKGKYKLIISTHALLYIETIPNVGLVIIDEMHKFGVLQRSKLVQSAERKNILFLTATPIPRSLNMILNGIINYDILPSYNKKDISTYWISTKKLEQLLNKIKDKKVYWVLPNIDDLDDDLGVISRYNFLKDKFNNVLLLHGRLKDVDKLEVVNKFKNMNFGILVSTTIIEIGINITDADIIIIENCDKFGLSQLHQLRGRVGRNGQKAYCFLISDYSTKKIQYMKKYSTGYEIAEKDLELRKSGRLTGLLQHGCSAFYFLQEDDEWIFKVAKKDKRILESFALFDGLV